MYRDLPRDEIADALRVVAAQYRSRLSGADGAALRRRPAPDVWSALEYGAHVRDVLVVQRGRAALALRINEPVFESMRAEERVVEQSYNTQDPDRVDAELREAAEMLAALFDSLGDSEWERQGIYNWPTRAARDLAWIGRHTVHELIHHLFDISRSTQPTPSAASG